MQNIDEDRRDVKRLANCLLAMIGTNGRPSSCVLASVRWELMRRLFTLLTLEQLQGGARREAAGNLLNRWKIHSLDWATQRIGADWNGYADEAEYILKDISAFCDSVFEY